MGPHRDEYCHAKSADRKAVPIVEDAHGNGATHRQQSMVHKEDGWRAGTLGKKPGRCLISFSLCGIESFRHYVGRNRRQPYSAAPPEWRNTLPLLRPNGWTATAVQGRLAPIDENYDFAPGNHSFIKNVRWATGLLLVPLGLGVAVPGSIPGARLAIDVSAADVENLSQTYVEATQEVRDFILWNMVSANG